MAEVQHFGFGWVAPALGLVMSISGCLLGLLLLAKARGCSGRSRRRLLSCAAVAIGAIGVWQLHFIAMLGFEIHRTPVRYDAILTAVSLGVALLGVGAGLVLAGERRTPGRARAAWRTGMAAVLILVGVAAPQYLGLAALRFAGEIGYDPRRVALSVALAAATAVAVLWYARSLRRLVSALPAAMSLATAIGGVHYLAFAAARVWPHTDQPLGDHGLGGVRPLYLIGPIVLVGALVLVMLTFFTLGSSTLDDLRVMVDEDPVDTLVIEDEILAEVGARVSAVRALAARPEPVTARHAARPGSRLGLPAGGLPGTGRPATEVGSRRRPPGPRAMPAIGLAWREHPANQPAWGELLGNATTPPAPPLPSITPGAAGMAAVRGRELAAQLLRRAQSSPAYRSPHHPTYLEASREVKNVADTDETPPTTTPAKRSRNRRAP